MTNKESKNESKNELKMRDIPEAERPYEKCLLYGPESLTDAELLAVILRTGTKEFGAIELARKILAVHEDSLIGLNHVTKEELTEIPGVGKVRSIQITCITEMAARMSRQRYSREEETFRSPEVIAAYYMEDMRHKDREEVIALYLNTKGKRIGEQCIFVGTVNSALLSAREIFVDALRHHAVSIILLHNHPSGDPTPSREDIQATRRLQAAGCLLGVPLLDHIIIGDNCYISLKERGILTNED